MGQGLISRAAGLQAHRAFDRDQRPRIHRDGQGHFAAAAICGVDGRWAVDGAFGFRRSVQTPISFDFQQPRRSAPAIGLSRAAHAEAVLIGGASGRWRRRRIRGERIRHR